ncbi:hypothetical protein [Embleya sp. NPDC005575]|uniref:hypothetical protein n=1 Tax=Embleya sp. NPDC005575 TaxID=3156892 RepID=UPI0033BB71BD
MNSPTGWSGRAGPNSSQAPLYFEQLSGLAVTHGHDDPDLSDPPDSPEYARLHAALERQ